jgi:hypothetical protein
MTEPIAVFGYANRRKPAMRAAHTRVAEIALVRGGARHYLLFNGGQRRMTETGD